MSYRSNDRGAGHSWLHGIHVEKRLAKHGMVLVFQFATLCKIMQLHCVLCAAGCG
jgi:hypothetical protein